MADYLEGHNNCGLKEGDLVLITRKAEDYENGWNEVWAMDDFVGRIGRIVKDVSRDGFEVQIIDDNSYPYSYPYFVLQKVEKDGYKEKYIKLLVHDCHRYCCPRSHIGFVHCPFGENCSLIAFEDWERYLDAEGK